MPLSSLFDPVMAIWPPLLIVQAGSLFPGPYNYKCEWVTWMAMTYFLTLNFTCLPGTSSLQRASIPDTSMHKLVGEGRRQRIPLNVLWGHISMVGSVLNQLCICSALRFSPEMSLFTFNFQHLPTLQTPDLVPMRTGWE